MEEIDTQLASLSKHLYKLGKEMGTTNHGAFTAAQRVLSKIISNLLNPQCPARHRQLRLANARLTQTLLKYKHSLEILHILGFVQDEENGQLLQFDKKYINDSNHNYFLSRALERIKNTSFLNIYQSIKDEHKKFDKFQVYNVNRIFDKKTILLLAYGFLRYYNYDRVTPNSDVAFIISKYYGFGTTICCINNFKTSHCGTKKMIVFNNEIRMNPLSYDNINNLKTYKIYFQCKYRGWCKWVMYHNWQLQCGIIGIKKCDNFEKMKNIFFQCLKYKNYQYCVDNLKFQTIIDIDNNIDKHICTINKNNKNKNKNKHKNKNTNIVNYNNNDMNVSFSWHNLKCFYGSIEKQSFMIGMNGGHGKNEIVLKSNISNNDELNILMQIDCKNNEMTFCLDKKGCKLVGKNITTRLSHVEKRSDSGGKKFGIDFHHGKLKIDENFCYFPAFVGTNCVCTREGGPWLTVCPEPRDDM